VVNTEGGAAKGSNESVQCTKITQQQRQVKEAHKVSLAHAEAGRPSVSVQCVFGRRDYHGRDITVNIARPRDQSRGPSGGGYRGGGDRDDRYGGDRRGGRDYDRRDRDRRDDYRRDDYDRRDRDYDRCLRLPRDLLHAAFASLMPVVLHVQA